MSKTGLTHISDRINQWRYVDKDGNEQWLHPVSEYKASEDILRGQAVSVVTESDEASNESDPDPYVRKTDTSRDVKTIGLALETVSKGQILHVLPFGMFTYDKTYKGLDGIDEYDPGFDYSAVGKKVYVKNNEPGNLTVNEDDILKGYKHIICVGYLTDAPVKNNPNQTITSIEISISGDERGPVDHTQFEAILGENVIINENDPIRFFAMGDEKDEKFNFKLTLTPQDHIYTNHDFIAIQRFDGKTCFLYPGESLDLEGLEDSSDLAFVKMSKIYNSEFSTKKINLDDTYNTEIVSNNIEVLKKALAEAFSEVSDGFEADIDSGYNPTNPFGWIDFTSKQPGGYYTIYISANLFKSFEQTTIYNHGSYNNQGTVVLADARIGTRRNILGAYVGTKFGTLEKGSNILLLRLGEYTLNPETLNDNALYKSTLSNNKEGTVFYLGNNGQITDKPYSQIDFVSKVATLKNANKLVVDVGHSSKYYSGSFPIGYMKPCIYASGRYIPEYGFIVMDGKTEYSCTAGSPYYKLYVRLQGQFSEGDIKGSDDNHFVIPLVTRQGQPMQIKYLSEGVFEDLTRTAFIRKMGRFEKETENEIEQFTLPKIDITSLVDFGITDSGYAKPDIDNLDIHLYIDPNKDYESGPHDWREIPVGFFNFNTYGTYGFSWSIEEDLESVNNHNPYGVYYIKANIGEGRGIAYVDGNNQAPMKVDGCYYKVYVARKELYPRQFDLNGVFKAYISDTVYDINGQPDTEKAVSGKAVLDAISSKVDVSELITTEGAIVKIGDKENNVVAKLINLISDEDLPIFSKSGKVIIGNDEDKQCLVAKDGKLYKTNTYRNEKIFETTTTTVGNDNAVETVYKINGDEIPNVTQVREHAELTIDGNNYMKSYANADVKDGKIHGMKFGYNGNVDASRVCGIRLRLNSGQVFDPDKFESNENTENAYIPIRYLNGGNFENYSEGLTVHIDSNHVPLSTESVSNSFGDIVKGVTLNTEVKYVESISNKVPTSKRFETVYDLENGTIHFYTGNRNSENPAFATLYAQQFVQGSFSKYKKIYGERFLDEKLFTTDLANGSKIYKDNDNPYKGLNSKLGSALQAAYELPLAYWLGNNEKNWYNKSLGIIVERVKDVANNINTSDERSISTVDENKSNNTYLKYNYTEQQIESIQNYYNTLTDNYGHNTTNTIGLLLAAAKETQERLLKTEASIFGADYENIPGNKKPLIKIDIEGVTQEPTTYGLNRLVRAICAELYDSTNPESGTLELKLDSEGNKITSLSRIDDIERTIKGTRNSDTDPEDFNVTSDNSLTSMDSSTYPYTPDITGENPNNGVNVTSLEKIDGNLYVSKEGMENKFNGTIDAIYRITKKLNALTTEINGVDNINAGPTRLIHAEDLLSKLIKEIYFNDNSDIPSNDEVSRFDKLTEALFQYKLTPRELPSDNDYDLEFGDAFKTKTINGKKLYFKQDTDDINIAKGDIPNTLKAYSDYANTIDIIIDALGDQWYRKTYVDSTNDRNVSNRFTKTISERLKNIEDSFDVAAKILLSNNTYFEDISNGKIIGPTSEHKEPIDDLLSKISYYLGSSSTELNLNDKSIIDFGVSVGELVGDSVTDGHNIAAGLRNLNTRLKDLEKYQAIIKTTIGNDIYGNTGENGKLNNPVGNFNANEGIYDYSFTSSPDIHYLYKDLQALKTTIWGEDKYFSSNDEEVNFREGNNVYKILEILFTSKQKYDNPNNTDGYYKFDNESTSENLLKDTTLIDMPTTIDELLSKSRLSVIEKEIYNLRSFLGLESRNITNQYATDLLRYGYSLKPEVYEVRSTDDNGNIIYAGSSHQKPIRGLRFINYSNTAFPNGEIEDNPLGDNQGGLFEEDSILNEILFNINSVRLLRTNVGTNSELLNKELVLDENSSNFKNPNITDYEKQTFKYTGDVSTVSHPNKFENAFLRQIKLKDCETGQATNTVTQRINNISDYLRGMGGYLTDKFEYLEGLDFIGRKTWWKSQLTLQKVKIGEELKNVYIYFKDTNKSDFYCLKEKYPNANDPIEFKDYFKVIESFLKSLEASSIEEEPLFSIRHEFNVDNGRTDEEITSYENMYFVSVDRNQDGTYNVYKKDQSEPIDTTDNLGGDITTSDSLLKIKPLHIVYRVIETDNTIKFNGKDYSFNSNGKYEDIISEVMIHNKLLEDIVKYIDKDISTAESGQPTTDSLI